ncbi:uncharacterized protein G2W53_044622 [Senna tora]|uniref:Uncharacterized protein n=1 Tax=Senna tora TaxID=362788 RepID=A0A834SCB7_9FABA|nr:uncharacterized protein G2W53_044622 [Senna tora]
MGDRFWVDGDRRVSKSSSIKDLAARKSDFLETSREVDRRATDSDGLETSWEASLCHRLHFDPAYTREILPRKKVDPWVIDFGWTTTNGYPSRRPSKIWPRASRITLKLLGRDHFDSPYAREILPSKKVEPRVIDFGWTATNGDTCHRPSKISLRTSRIALKLLGRFPCVIGFILTQYMHRRFCLEKKLTHNSMSFVGRRFTRSTAGRPTRMALKLLGRPPYVIGIILTPHMHIRVCLGKKLNLG